MSLAGADGINKRIALLWTNRIATLPRGGHSRFGNRNLLEFIQNKSREKVVAVVITSHDMDELGQLAGRIQSDIVNGL